MLLIDNVNVLVNVWPGVHELQISPPVRDAATNSKSPEVHELAGGKVCANDFVETINKKTKQQTLKERNK